MSDGIFELRLRYTEGGMTRVIQMIDKMKLGDLPAPLALFLVHASNAENWHPTAEREEDQ